MTSTDPKSELPDYWIFGDIEQRKTNAYNVLSSLFPHIGVPNSFLDVGGGAGSWCAAAKKLGVKKVLLVDACPPQQVVPELSQDEQLQANLETGIPIQAHFELINCIEVIEHLTEDAGKRLIQQMTSSGNIILFSAAIPGQGGFGHINEQLHDHWHAKFSDYGFDKYDILRPMLFSQDHIPSIYRQNLFLYTKKGFAENLKNLPQLPDDIELIRTTHLQALYHKDSIDLRTALGAIPNAINRSIRRRFGH
jgi:hypothetical protein